MANPSRKLVDDIGGWLKIYDDGSVERSGPPEAQHMMAIVAPYNTPCNGITVHDILTDPPLRLYLPEAAPMAGHRLPVLLHFHAGAFCVTNPTWSLYHHFYARLAASVPIAGILSITLPLAPEHRLPAAIAAGYAAIAWLRSLAWPELPAEPVPEPASEPASRLRAVADFSRVFLIGDSLGANLVHHVAIGFNSAESGYWDPIRLAGAILLNPGFSRSVPSRSELENHENPYMDSKLVDKFFALALPVGATRDHPYICPMGAAAPSLAGLMVPPLLVNVGTMDPLRDTQIEYCNSMKRAGKTIEVVLSPGMDHMFYLNMSMTEPDTAMAECISELIEAIKSFIGRHGACLARM